MMVNMFQGRALEKKRRVQICYIIISLLICAGITLSEQVSADTGEDISSGSVSPSDINPGFSIETVSSEPNSISNSCGAGSINTDYIQPTTPSDTTDNTEISRDTLFIPLPAYDTDGSFANTASGVSDDSDNRVDVTFSFNGNELLYDQDVSHQISENINDDLVGGSESGSENGHTNNGPIPDIHPEETGFLSDNEDINIIGAISVADITSLPYTANIIPVTGDVYSQYIEDTSISVPPLDSLTDPEVKTLAIVEVSPDSSLSMPLVAATDNDWYTFTGTYLGGTIKIKKSGSYHLTDTLITNAGQGNSGTHNFAIKISGSNVILDGGYDSVTGRIPNGITGNGANYLDGVLVTGSGITIQNFGSITGFTGFSSAGIYSGLNADSITISDSTMAANRYGVLSYGSFATISGNDMSGNTNDGIYSIGDDATITGNNLVGNGDSGIRSTGDNVNIIENIATENSNGIVSGGVGATITGNTVSKNVNGIVITDIRDDVTIQGNSISSNTNAGIRIDGGGGTGSGIIYNNYFANNNNVGGTGALGTFDWSITPTSGVNVMGGPNIAGNYWSNPSGTGWSDTQSISITGYSMTEDYEVKPGSKIYDLNPLVRHPVPAVPGSLSHQIVSIPVLSTQTVVMSGIHVVITNITLSSGAVPGSSTTVRFTVEEEGIVSLPVGATIVFIPSNEVASQLGEFSVIKKEKGFDLGNLPFTIPLKAGEYQYSFSPYLIQIDPLTNKEKLIAAGKIEIFRIIVGIDNRVTVVQI